MSTEEEEPVAASPSDGVDEAENGEAAAADGDKSTDADAPSSGDDAPSPPVDEMAAPAAQDTDESSPPPAAAVADPVTVAEVPENNGEQQRQAIVAPLPLDWTKMAECDELDKNPANIVRYPWDVAEIDPEDTHLTLVGTHGQKITRMGSQLKDKVSPNITNLVLRSHLIRTMEGIAGMEHLELLELYDNMVDELRELDGMEDENGEKSGLPGKNLRVLDISYNVIRDMGPVSLCPNLQELYIAQNKIKEIKGIKHLKLLRKIDLGANRIRVMDEEELSGLESLEELWLGKNKIQHIGGIGKLTKLRRLDVQSNRLTKIENLEAQVNTLEELYLAHNGIDVEGAKCDTGLALPFTQLNTIDMSRNRLADTSPFAHLTCLSDLWISGNDIKTFDDIQHLGNLTELDGVYLEYNPVADEFEYRKKLAELIPSLTQIDANMIGGLAQHGYTSVGGSGGNLVERMRQMQEAAIQKALTDQELKPASVGDLKDIATTVDEEAMAADPPKDEPAATEEEEEKTPAEEVQKETADDDKSGS